jgi:hypothetical protein
MNMQTFTVEFTITQSGSIQVPARSIEDAKQVAELRLASRGAKPSEIINESVELGEATEDK